MNRDPQSGIQQDSEFPLTAILPYLSLIFSFNSCFEDVSGLQHSSENNHIIVILFLCHTMVYKRNYLSCQGDFVTLSVVKENIV